MGLKTAFSIAILSGAAVYGVQETKKQVFYDCTTAYGQVELVNPNRYRGHNNLHIAHTTPSGEVKRYVGVQTFGPQQLVDEAGAICRTGQPTQNLRLRS